MVKLHLKRDRSQKQCLKAISEWIVETCHANCCLVTEPGIAGEREVREEVEETSGVQEDNWVVNMEWRDRGLEGRERGNVWERQSLVPADSYLRQKLTCEGSGVAIEMPAVDQSDDAREQAWTYIYIHVHRLLGSRIYRALSFVLGVWAFMYIESLNGSGQNLNLNTSCGIKLVLPIVCRATRSIW